MKSKAERWADEMDRFGFALDSEKDIAAELRRLAAVESDCAPYLKEGETPAERIKRALGDADSLMSPYRDVIAKRDALKAGFERTLAECRDAYPVPEVGSELEGLWGQAMGDPVSVGAYVKACATSQKKEIDALKAELERIKTLEPVAMRYDFDGYGWQYIDNGSGSDWLTRHKDGEALYALGSKTA